MIVETKGKYIAPDLEVLELKVRQVLCVSGDALNDYGRENWSDE